MLNFIFIFLISFNVSIYEPTCKIYRDDLQFTGVSISENTILTVGHIGYKDYMFVEFYGENGHRFKVKAKVIKQTGSLTLLTYDKPIHITGAVSVLKISTKKPTRVDVKGWDGQFFYWYEGVDASKVLIKQKIDSFIAIENGMLVGIQSHQYGDNVYFINSAQILDFIDGP